MRKNQSKCQNTAFLSVEIQIWIDFYNLNGKKELSYSLFFAQAEKVGLNWNDFLVTKTDFQTTGQKYTNFWNELSET